jgi:transcription termination factor Rho
MDCDRTMPADTQGQDCQQHTASSLPCAGRCGDREKEREVREGGEREERGRREGGEREERGRREGGEREERGRREREERGGEGGRRDGGEIREATQEMHEPDGTR